MTDLNSEQIGGSDTTITSETLQTASSPGDFQEDREIGTGEAERILGVSAVTIHKWCADPNVKLKPSRVFPSGRRRFSLKAVLEFANTLKTNGDIPTNGAGQ